MRYISRFKLPERMWYVFDTQTQQFKGTGTYSKHTGNKRADRLNGEILEAKTKSKNYGMRHPHPAPAPLAYKD